jgi:hypothetical protein
MTSTRLVSWFGTVSVILVFLGMVFAFFGLGILPVERNVLLPWVSALYGAIMMGWGTTLFFLGRVALRRQDASLIQPLLLGIVVWLAVEAVFSARYGVWFNVGVDAGVLALFTVPLVVTMRATDSNRAGRTRV